MVAVIAYLLFNIPLGVFVVHYFLRLFSFLKNEILMLLMTLIVQGLIALIAGFCFR